jgi:hypothetical protein
MMEMSTDTSMLMRAARNTWLMIGRHLTSGPADPNADEAGALKHTEIRR